MRFHDVQFWSSFKCFDYVFPSILATHEYKPTYILLPIFIHLLTILGPSLTMPYEGRMTAPSPVVIPIALRASLDTVHGLCYIT